MNHTILLSVVTLTYLVTPSRAATLWDEDINGPLANVPASATSLGNLFTPESALYGYVGHRYLGGGVYVYSPDYFTFTVPLGYQVDSISAGFGRSLPFWIGSPTFGSQLGSTSSTTPGNLLPQFGIGQIPSGIYGMYVNDVEPNQADTSVAYRLYFQISPIPEPSMILLLCCSTVAFYIQRRIVNR